MPVIQVLFVCVLGAIFIQDFRSRSVYWFWFPLLAALFIIFSLLHKQGHNLLQSSLTNVGFILLQLILVTVYFSIKNRQIVNVTRSLLGWGDVLFLLSIAFYLSPLNYILFYVVSLFLVLVVWLMGSILSNQKNKQIPLAGLQAIIFILCLFVDWYSPKIDLTDDSWLLHYLLK